MLKDFIMGKLNGENTWIEILRFFLALCVGLFFAVIGILSLVLFGGGIKKKRLDNNKII